MDAGTALRVAQDLGTGVTLRVREDTAAALGAAVIAGIFALARDEFPDVALSTAVECGNAPGLAIALLRRGIDRIALRGPADMLTRVAAIAAAHGGAILDDDPTPALDLARVSRPQQACERWLASGGTDGQTAR